MSHQELRKKFIKDSALPIPLPDSPYFEYFIDLYEEDYNSRTKWTHFTTKVTEYETGHSRSFLADANILSRKVRNVIGSTPAFKKFQDFWSNNNKQYDLRKTMNVSQSGKVYTKENTGKKFISVDISSGNFTCLKHHDPEILLNCDNFKQLVEVIAQKEFICKEDKPLERTDFEQSVIDYVVSSKYLRQVVFGYLNPKAQQKIQRYLIGLVIEVLVDELNMDINSFITCTSDEAVFVCDEEKFEEIYNSTKNALTARLPDLTKNLKVEAFELLTIEEGDRLAGFVKKFLFNSNSKASFEIKTAPAYLFAQVYKKFKGLPIIQNDLVFVYEGMVAYFKDPLFSA